MRSLIVGTAGHIDHGKSALVRALTGTDPDRLKEEKERGITIDLGFAHMDAGAGQVVSFIDVPGHERFVRNMLAGAHGIDAVLLVVAADESVMPQTREHFHICRLLGIDRGLVLAECLASLAARYRDLLTGQARAVVDAWRRRAAPMLGRRVEWDSSGARHTGLAENIDDDGALIVTGTSGTLRIRSGEVRWL